MTQQSSHQRFSRADKQSLVVIILTTVVTAFLYSELPDPMPIHWNASGEVDGYGSRLLGAWLMPGIAAATWLMFKLILVISPKGYALEKSAHVVEHIQIIVILFMCLIGLTITLFGAGYNVPVAKLILVGLGLMIIFLGKVMNKIRKNFYIGIRTPWTLADDEIWSRTHRLCGRLMLLAGVLTILAVFTPWSVHIAVAGIIAAVLIPIAYSFVIYRKLHAGD